ncbi:DAK2 domain-containing protein [Kineosporia rhizophila]|uniref:DAK2 domain-containing protein n=1 Tax=Kineosporia rhizophila TaxID=84633 RepID=UPI001E3D8FE6|nr:DAK2 domain-containing protein [Kineosporia rhizophila]
MLSVLDPPAARRWAMAALAALADAREEIDALNVFPVPDGDTGTNLYLTLEAAVASAQTLPADAPVAAVADAFARGALLGARGNSGVIGAQLLRGWAQVLAENTELTAQTAVECFRRADEQAWKAVHHPVEGTILSVSRAAAQAAQAAAGSEFGADLEAVVSAAAEAAQLALAYTPVQLPELAAAGVVDAGGRGLVVLLDALAEVVLADHTHHRPNRRRRRPANLPALDFASCHGVTAVAPLTPAVGVPVLAGQSWGGPAMSARAGHSGQAGHAARAGHPVPAGEQVQSAHSVQPGHPVLAAHQMQPMPLAQPAHTVPAVPAGAGAGRRHTRGRGSGREGWAAVSEPKDAGARVGRTAHRQSVAGEGAATEALSQPLDALTVALPDPLPGPPIATERRAVPQPLGGREVPPVLKPESPAADLYELMFLLDTDPQDGDARVDELRERLDRLGDSLVIVGGPDLWQVHVHVADAGAAVESAIAAGRPRQIRITHLAAQATAGAARPPHRTRSTGLVACAAGPGLAELFESTGATVVAGGPGRRPSTAAILAAIHRTRATDVAVLPNDADTLSVARIAAASARAEGVRVTVIPTRAQVQGLAAAAVHDRERRFDDDVVSMSAAAGAARDGAVTVAGRNGLTSAGECRIGDALGVLDGDFVVIGQDLAAVAVEVLDRLLASGGELVTIVVGAGGHDALARTVAAHARGLGRGLEVNVVDGGQPRYPLLIGVE